MRKTINIARNKDKNKARTRKQKVGGFLKKTLKEIKKPLGTPVDYRALSKKYLDRALPIFKRDNIPFKGKKGAMEIAEDETLVDGSELLEAVKKDVHMAMNIDKEYILYFLKMCKKHNFPPRYTSWYRTIESDKIQPKTYEITDHRTWNYVEGGFMYIWGYMTGDKKSAIEYILEDLELLAKYYFMRNNGTWGMYEYLKRVYRKYVSDIKNITPEEKTGGPAIKQRIREIVDSQELTKIKVAAYLRKFNNVKVETINKIDKNVKEILDKHRRYYNPRHIEEIKDRQTSSFINREQQFMDLLQRQKLNPSDYIEPVEAMETIDVFGSRKAPTLSSASPRLPSSTSNQNPLRLTLDRTPSFLRGNSKKTISKTRSIPKTRTRTRTRSRSRSI